MADSYVSLFEQSRVEVKVPREGKYMNFIESHKFEAPDGRVIPVDDHWRSSSIINGKLVQRNFFNITPQQLGKKITARVEVVRKTTSTGKVVTLLNISPDIESQRAQYSLGFAAGDNGRLKVLFHKKNGR